MAILIGLGAAMVAVIFDYIDGENELLESRWRFDALVEATEPPMAENDDDVARALVEATNGRYCVDRARTSDHDSGAT